MSRLPITIATWDYDRVRALVDGRVRVEGCDVNYLTMPVEECFERAYFHGEFDVAEIGFSPYLIALSRRDLPVCGDSPLFCRGCSDTRWFISAPIAASRGPPICAASGSVCLNIRCPPCCGFEGYLQDEYGIAAKDINWVQAGLENPGRRDKFPLNLPDNFPLVSRNDATLTGHARRRPSSTPSCRPAARRVSSTAIPRCGGCSPIIGRPSENTTGNRDFSQSCTQSE